MEWWKIDFYDLICTQIFDKQTAACPYKTLDLVRLSLSQPSRYTAITPADLSHRRSERPWAGKGTRPRWKRSSLKARSPGAQWDKKTWSASCVRSFHPLMWWCCESCPGVVHAFCVAVADGAEERERQQKYLQSLMGHFEDRPTFYQLTFTPLPAQRLKAQKSVERQLNNMDNSESEWGTKQSAAV